VRTDGNANTITAPFWVERDRIAAEVVQKSPAMSNRPASINRKRVFVLK
jgi:hypothetical protein